MKSDAPEVNQEARKLGTGTARLGRLAQQGAGLGGMRRSGILRSTLGYLGVV